MSFILAAAAVLVMVGIDQLVKYLAVTKLAPIGEYPLIEGVFKLSFVENRGAAFGLMQGFRWVFIVLTGVVLIALAVYFVKLPRTKETRLFRVMLTVLCAGALGNFVDRVRQGYVVDMFYFHWFEFPVFNVADILVVCSTIFLCIMILFPKTFKTDFVFPDEKKEAGHADTD